MKYKEIPMTPEIAENLKGGDRIRLTTWSKGYVELKYSLLNEDKLYFIGYCNNKQIMISTYFYNELILLKPVEYEYIYNYRYIDDSEIHNTYESGKKYYKNDEEFLNAFTQELLEYYEKIEFTKRECKEVTE